MFYARLKARLDEIGMSFYRLNQLSDIATKQFYWWKTGKRKPTNKEMERLAGVEELNLTYETLRGWRAADEYTVPELEIALRIKKDETGSFL